MVCVQGSCIGLHHGVCVCAGKVYRLTPRCACREVVRAYQCHVPNVVPHVSAALVRGQTEGLEEAVDGHVVLLGIETAQAQVGEQFCTVDPHLE